jgi:hypothetical protein
MIARQGRRGEAGLCVAWSGLDGHGGAWPSAAGYGMALKGMAWQARRDQAWRDETRQDTVWTGKAGTARHGFH